MFKRRRSFWHSHEPQGDFLIAIDGHEARGKECVLARLIVGHLESCRGQVDTPDTKR